MAKVINPTGGGSGGYFPSVFLYNSTLTSSGSATLVGQGKTYDGVWYQKPIPRLPNEYQEVEHIGLSGTQYIDIGLVPSVPIHIEANVNFDNVSNRMCVVSATQSNIGCGFGILNNASVHLYYLSSSIISTSGISCYANTWYKMNYSLLSNSVSITSNSDTFSYSISNSSTISNSLYVGANNTNGTANYYVSGKLKDVIITSDTEVVRHLVPCYRKSDDVIGMYDITNDVFYTNSGTGDFTKGNDATPTIDGFIFRKIEDLGTYTWTATQGSTIHTDTLNITEPIHYDVRVGTYLYLEGNEYISLTGGWGITGYAYASGKTTIIGTKNADNLYTLAQSDKCVGFGTTLAIDVSNYSKICIDISTANYSGASGLLLSTAKKYVYNTKTFSTDIVHSERQIDEYDISDQIGEKYIFIYSQNYTQRYGNWYGIWLE